MTTQSTNDDQHVSLERLQETFDSKIMNVIKDNISRNISLDDKLNVRIALQKDLHHILRTVNMQVDDKYAAFQLLIGFSELAHNAGETDLGVQCIDYASTHFANQVNDSFNRVIAKATIIQYTALFEKRKILYHTSNLIHISPRTISKMLDVANEVENSLMLLFENFNNRDLEGASHIVLNGVRLLYDLLEPLIYWNCGKYITRSLLFAAVCMESIINLCTIKYVALRSKLYVSALYSALVHSSSHVEINSIVCHAHEQYCELKEREEMNPMITIFCKQSISSFRDDVEVMKNLAKFYLDPSTFSASEFLENLNLVEDGENAIYTRTMREKLLVECCRVQQVTSCNLNETWKRRSSILLEAVAKYIDDLGIENVTFSSRTLVDIYALTVLYGQFIPVPHALHDSLQKFVVDVMENRTIHFGETDAAESDSEKSGDACNNMNVVDNAEQDVIVFSDVEKVSTDINDEKETEEVLRKELRILQNFARLINQRTGIIDVKSMNKECADSTGKDNIDDIESPRMKQTMLELIEEFQISLSLLRSIDSLCQSKNATNRKSFLQKISLNVWKRYLRPTLEENLSSKTFSEDMIGRRLNAIVPTFIAAFRSLLPKNSEDPMLVASLGIITVIILKEMHRIREAISIARRTIDVVEDYRASRVDISLHIPEDVVDIQSIQRAAVSIKRESFDWFQSFRRLGAHAYAGFGLFGTSSSHDMMDISLAEIHTKLLSVYFRLEIEYEISKLACKELNKHVDSEIGKKVSWRISKIKNKSKKQIGTEKLSCVAYLQKYCRKNLYQKCLICFEMARAENKIDSAVKHLQKGLHCIEEIESTEERLSKDFDRLVTKNDFPFPSPVILGRSHRFVSVAIISSGTVENCYYRILAREEAADVSLKECDNDYGGCEIEKSTHDISNLAEAVVKITNLIPGERYLLASAAFDDKSGHIIDISPASSGVEALNPLPTTLLWHCLSDIAFKMQIKGMGQIASSRVIQRFMLTPPKPNTLCLGKGTNFNYGQQSILASSVIDAASPLAIYCFIESFIRMYSVAYSGDECSAHLHWDQRKTWQINSLNALENITSVVSLAAQSSLWKLMIQGILLGYEILGELLLYDEVSLAVYLHKPIVLLIVPLQSLPKFLWNELEHYLYSRLLFHLIRCAVVASSTSACSKLLSKLHVPKSNSCIDATSATLTMEILENYCASVLLFDMIPENDDFVRDQISNLFGTQSLMTSLETDPKKFWAHPLPSLTIFCKGWGCDLIANNRNQTSALIEEGLNCASEIYTQFLEVILFILGDCSSNFPPDKDISKREKISLLLKKFPVLVGFLCIEAKLFNDLWNLKFISVEGPIVNECGSDRESILINVNNDDISQAEIRKELRILASFCLLYASAQYDGSIGRNLYPNLSNGPEEFIDTTYKSVIFSQGNNKCDLREEETNVCAHEYILHLYAAIVLFSKSNFPVSTIDASIIFWNYIVRGWIDPWEFREQFGILKPFLIETVFSLVFSIEKLTRSYNSHTGEFGLSFSVDDEIVDRNDFDLPMKRIKEYLFLARSPMKYFLKVLWTFGEHNLMVNAGVRLITIYMSNLCESLKDVGDHIFPLIIESQRTLLLDANTLITSQKEELRIYIKEWMDLQVKKNRKKLKIAHSEKSEEEMKYQSHKDILEGRVLSTEKLISKLHAEFDNVNILKKRFDSVFSSGSQLLEKVRQLAIAFMKKCQESNDIQQFPNLSDCLVDESIRFEFDSILDQFDQVSSIIREKKESLTLLECLRCQGNILIAFGCTQKARRVWLDAVDGLFNTFDSCKSWEAVVEKASKSLNHEIVHGCLPVVSILGSLSKFCANIDWDAKSTYCRMAAKLCLIPFSGSICFPSLPHGFATYVCTDLGGIGALNVNDGILNLSDLSFSLEEVVFVLIHQDYYIESLPVFVLLEHIYACYLQQCSRWFRARLLRVQTLINLHFFSEAVTMLAGIQLSLTSIENGLFTDSSVEAILSTHMKCSHGSRHKNGLCCPIENVQFCNTLPPDHENNKNALEWIRTLPSRLKEFMDTFVVKIPVLLEGQNELDSAEYNDHTTDSSQKKVRLCTPTLNALVTYICAEFLAEVSYLNSEHTSKDFPFYINLSSEAEILIDICMEKLTEIYDGSCTCSPQKTCESEWIIIFGEAWICKSKLFSHRREYKCARASLIMLLKRIYEGILSPQLRTVYTHLWFKCRYHLSLIASDQGRYDDAMKMVQNGLVDSIGMLHGFFTRKFMYCRALLNYYRGNISSAELDVNKAIEMYETSKERSQCIIWCYLLKISILRSAYCVENDEERGGDCLDLCINLSRRSIEVAEISVHHKGFLGADINASYLLSDVLSSTLENELYSPFQHNLSSGMTNSFNHSSGFSLQRGKDVNLPFSNEDGYSKIIRPAPIDEFDTYISSSYANIYLDEVNLLSRCHATLCNILYERRLNSDKIELLEEQILVGEKGLKLLRYVHKADAAVRIILLLSIGRTRQDVNKGLSVSKILFIDGVAQPTFPQDQYLEALKTAFRIAMRRGDSWDLMKCACLEISECIFNSYIPNNRYSDESLKDAVLYLNLSIEIQQKKNNLIKHSVQLSHEITMLAKSVPEKLSDVIIRFYGVNSKNEETGQLCIHLHVNYIRLIYSQQYFPSTADFEDDARNCAARVALCLLRMLEQECDSLLNFSLFPAALKQDMHNSLRESFTTYNTACCVTINDNSLDTSCPIIQNSISTLLVPYNAKFLRYFINISIIHFNFCRLILLGSYSIH